jgi:hypothetical protein
MGMGGGSDAGRRAVASTINIRQTLGRGPPAQQQGAAIAGWGRHRVENALGKKR